MKNNINTVSILGANGTMGINVAGIFASFGNAKVYLISREKTDSVLAIEAIVKSVKTETVRENLLARSYEDLEECISNSDLVFESTSENIKIKKDVFEKINPFLKENTIVSTGTSGLSINELSKFVNEKNRDKFIGMHFFNPSYVMTLCEIIPNDRCEQEYISMLKDYLQDKLYREVVIVNDAPGFLGNRIGFYFINMAIIYAKKFEDNGGIDYIDAILSKYTGRNMPPILTADFVGLDVHKAIIDNISNNTDDLFTDAFKMPEFMNDLLDNGYLGKKTSKGFYTTEVLENGEKTHLVYDIKLKSYRPIKKYKFEFIDLINEEIYNGNYKKAYDILIKDVSTEAEICKYFLINYFFYSEIISSEIAEKITSADIVMNYGFNWISPSAVVELFGGIDKIKELIHIYVDVKIVEKYDIDKIVENLELNRNDYRQYLKSSRS